MANQNKHVDALFDRIYQIIEISESTLGYQFLKSLRVHAQTNKLNWQERLSEYLNALQDQAKLSSQQMNEVRALASKCPVPSPSTWTVMSPLLWLTFGVFAVLGITTMSLTKLQVASFIVSVSVAAGYGAWIWCKRPIGQQPTGMLAWERVIGAVFYMIVAALISIFVPCIIQGGYFEYLRHAHTVQSSQFKIDPDGMVAFQKLAKDQYGLDVVLNAPENDWVSTTLALKGASPAMIDVSAGFCILSMDSNSLFSDFGIANVSLRKLWMKGVLMHELGHCLDVSRDQRGFGDKTAMGVYSIAPSDSRSVIDVQTYVSASDKDASKLWREAYADIVAIGYWKVTSPESYILLADNLMEKRTTNKTDKIHRTMCWIKAATASQTPGSIGRIPEWADNIRSNTLCQGV